MKSAKITACALDEIKPVKFLSTFVECVCHVTFFQEGTLPLNEKFITFFENFMRNVSTYQPVLDEMLQ